MLSRSNEEDEGDGKEGLPLHSLSIMYKSATFNSIPPSMHLYKGHFLPLQSRHPNLSQVSAKLDSTFILEYFGTSSEDVSKSLLYSHLFLLLWMLDF